jgi:Uma2 family endonuclease
VLPNGARRSPDASWTPKAEIEKLTPESRQSILASLPGVCHRAPVEIGSHSNGSRQNARVYRQLGWLIDPQSRTVEVYRPGRDPETIEGADSVAGEGPVDGFILDLRTVWDPLAS